MSKPKIWLIDSERQILFNNLKYFSEICEVSYFPNHSLIKDLTDYPNAIFLSSDIDGGANGIIFSKLRALSHGIPLLVVSRLRSLTTAISFFRAGANDFLSLPLDFSEIKDLLSKFLYPKFPQDNDPIDVTVEITKIQPNNTDSNGLDNFKNIDIDDILGSLTCHPFVQDSNNLHLGLDDFPTGLLISNAQFVLLSCNKKALNMFNVKDLSSLQKYLIGSNLQIFSNTDDTQSYYLSSWENYISTSILNPQKEVLSYINLNNQFRQKYLISSILYEKLQSKFIISTIIDITFLSISNT